LPHVTDLDRGLKKKEDKQMELISTRWLEGKKEGKKIAETNAYI
jgi:urease gamma subunit